MTINNMQNYYVNPDGSLTPYTATFLTGSNAKGKETLSVGGSAVPFAAAPTGATKAVITTETADVRYWIDGSTPTTTVGHLIKAGGGINLDSAGQIANFKAIAVSGSAVLQISYF